MKNIHILPTDKPSILHEFGGQFHIEASLQENFRSYNIYITSDEEIKEGDWCINLAHKQVVKPTDIEWANSNKDNLKKIILTTDPQLIENGVQAIDDGFLEWFVKNPSCEWVEVIYDKDAFPYGVETAKGYGWYQIIIPQEEPTEEAKQRAANYMALKGALDTQYVDFSNPNADKISSASTASFKQERMYSEEDMISFAIFYYTHQGKATEYWGKDLFKEWFEQFKKK
jgi:hypothetical protein